MGKSLAIYPVKSVQQSPSSNQQKNGRIQRKIRENLRRQLRGDAQDPGCKFSTKESCYRSTPVMEITEDGGVWTITTSTTLKTMELKFKLGEEFDETTPDGRDVTAVVNLEGGKIVTVQKAKKEGQKSTKSVREMNGADELIYTMTIDGHDMVCVQKFKRV